MHACLDFRPALHQGTGVGTYVRCLLAALARGYPDDRFTAFSASWKHRLDDTRVPDGVAKADVRLPVRALDLLWHRVGIPSIERFVGPIDVAHSPSPMPIPTRRARRVVTVHDAYFMRHPEDVAGPVRRDYVPLARRAVRSADAVVTVSQTTADEVVDLFGVPRERLTVTPLGVDPAFLSPADPASARSSVRNRWGIHAPFMLFTGTREPRKDLGTLLAAMPPILARSPEVTLVLAGPDGHRWDETWDAAPAAARSGTVFLPHLAPAQLAQLYAAAVMLVLPSRWEGFGLTALEAMAVGTPVVASRAGALPEVLGDAAEWFETGNAEDLADACGRLLEDTRHSEMMSRRGRDRAAGFSWERTAERTRMLYRSLVT